MYPIVAFIPHGQPFEVNFDDTGISASMLGEIVSSAYSSQHAVWLGLAPAEQLPVITSTPTPTVATPPPSKSAVSLPAPLSTAIEPHKILKRSREEESSGGGKKAASSASASSSEPVKRAASVAVAVAAGTGKVIHAHDPYPSVITEITDADLRALFTENPLLETALEAALVFIFGKKLAEVSYLVLSTLAGAQWVMGSDLDLLLRYCKKKKFSGSWGEVGVQLFKSVHWGPYSCFGTDLWTLRGDYTNKSTAFTMLAALEICSTLNKPTSSTTSQATDPWKNSQALSFLTEFTRKGGRAARTAPLANLFMDQALLLPAIHYTAISCLMRLAPSDDQQQQKALLDGVHEQRLLYLQSLSDEQQKSLAETLESSRGLGESYPSPEVIKRAMAKTKTADPGIKNLRALVNALHSHCAPASSSSRS